MEGGAALAGLGAPAPQGGFKLGVVAVGGLCPRRAARILTQVLI
jgi:hypothetical protein